MIFYCAVSRMVSKKKSRQISIIAGVLLLVIYGVIAIVIKKKHIVFLNHKYPLPNSDAFVTVALIVALWITALNNIQQGSSCSFWYETGGLLALVVIVFVLVRMSLLADFKGFNPATAWWEALVKVPLAPALGVALVNAICVLWVVQLAARLTHVKKTAIPSLTIYVTALIASWVGIIVFYT